MFISLLPAVMTLCFYLYLIVIIFRHYVPLNSTLARHRYGFSLLIGFITMVMLNLPVLLFPLQVSLVFTLLFMAGYFFLMPGKLNPDSLLSVTIYPLKPTHANIHLTKSSQAFNRQTYRELPAVVKRLAKLGVTTVTLSSPMLGKGHAPRDTKILAEKLKPLIGDLEIHPVKVRPPVLGVITLWIAKYLRRAESVKKLDLFSWYQITLTLKTSDLH